MVVCVLFASTQHAIISFLCRFHAFSIIIKGSLEVKLPTIWTDGKEDVGRVREEKSRREKIREEKE